MKDGTVGNVLAGVAAGVAREQHRNEQVRM